jgi:hypothetical protein
MKRAQRHTGDRRFKVPRRDPSAALRSARDEEQLATRVAAIQMQCGPDPEANLAKAIARVREAARARRANHLPALSFFARNTSASPKTTNTSSWPEPSLARPPSR